MTKAILKYDLSDEGDRLAHLRALKSLDLVLCLEKLQRKFREVDKYDNPPITSVDFYDLLAEYGIELWDLLE